MEATRRITRQPNGTYLWSAVVDKDYEHRSYSITVTFMGIFCLCIILLGLLFSSMTGNWRDSWIVPVCALSIFGFTWLLCHFLENLPGETCSTYLLTDDFVKSGFGRNAVYFTFRKALILTFRPRYIELKGKHSTFRIYAAEEDMPFLRDYLLERMPESIDVRELP